MSQVAVWMPVYNEERHLQAALESVMEQRFKDFTLYVSDNHSTDASTAIIRDYSLRFPDQFVALRPASHLSGIEHMKYMWDYIRDEGTHEYSIHLGAHDLWPPEHLRVLVGRMDRGVAMSAARGRTVALTYSDTWVINDSGVRLYPLSDVMQVDQMRPEIMPQFVLMGVRAPHLFGIWNEAVRRKIRVRHCCSGWDHFVVAEAAMHGAIAFEGATTLGMRISSYDKGLAGYGSKHLAEDVLAAGPLDFRNQLEWCVHLIDVAVQSTPEATRAISRSLLTSSMVSMYLTLRSYNLQAVPGAPERFFADPRVQQIILASRHIDEQVRLFIDCKT